MTAGPKSSATDRPSRPLDATTLSQFVRLDGCERWLWYQRFPDQREALRRRWGLTIQPLAPLLSAEGSAFERDTLEALAAAGRQAESLDGKDVAATRAALRCLDSEPRLLIQAALAGTISGHPCSGRPDLLCLSRAADGRVHLLVADVKASRTERVEHRVQVAFYAHLARAMFAEYGLAIDTLKGAVLRRGSELPYPGGEWPTFDLAPYLEAVEHLIAGPAAPLTRVEATPFGELDFHLGPKCDGCLYNQLCFYSAAERQDLALVPQIQPAERRALRAQGVKTLRDLATLKELPRPRVYGRSLEPSPGRHAQAHALAATWPLAASLDRLVQRARRVLRRFDPSVDAASRILDAGVGGLPDDTHIQALVKVFVDAQRDYLQDRLYLVGALVVGPAGERSIVHLCDGPPNEASERALLTDWLSELLPALARAAGQALAPVHLYVYDRGDQKALIEALARHLDAVGAFPALHDLFTSHAALSQSMVSFLADEVRSRLNLDLTCQSLHLVARQVWADGAPFDWSDGEIDFHRLFQARMFDHRRAVRRSPDGRIEAPPGGVSADDPMRVPIESASRFNSQIPLEYAYGAWGCLPGAAGDALLRPFRAISAEQLRRFQARRLKALAHLERAFTVKNRGIEKTPLALSTLGLRLEAAVPLKQMLSEFLALEHHARLQAGLELFTRPIGERVAAGRALLLECVGRDGQVWCFRHALGQLDVQASALRALRLREGDWIVLNPSDEGSQAHPWRLARGRLGRLLRLSEVEVVVELLSLSFPGSRFRYGHDTSLEPLVGQLYSVDSMLDDLNGDRQQAACKDADSNTLYRLLVGGREETPGTSDPEVDRRAAAFGRALVDVTGVAPTAAQLRVIGENFAEQLLLVQGPPGTGKSRTLGWATIARIAARGAPYRVAVTAKTHTAVDVALASVAAAFEAERNTHASAQPIPNEVQIVRVDGEAAPASSRWISTFGSDRLAKAFELDALLAAPLLVVGGTTAGLDNLLKRARHPSLERQSLEKPFDLLVVDEASQLSLPEALLASVGVAEHGQFLVVGDHRQMPPILAHLWERERQRSLEQAQPYRSLFLFLRERGFRCLALEESFRLPPLLASFLEQAIYRHDGVPFHSRQALRLASGSFDDAFVAAALDPDYPIVVIEHEEHTSQQRNELEVELSARLIRACITTLGLNARDGIGVVVPHRAQKAALAARFPDLAEAGAVDTVERFQGGERDVIVVSATASDPAYVLQEAEFLLNPNRFTVAVSRPRLKLVVIAASSVFRLIPADLERFQDAALWKQLRFRFATHPLWSGQVKGIEVHVLGGRACEA